MKIPEGWKLVPVEPTKEMLENGSAYTDTYSAYVTMIERAPTPPAQEVEPVSYQMWHPNFPTWVNCSKSVADKFAARNEGHEIRPLYTHPANDGLRKAAENMIKQWTGSHDVFGAIQQLRAALEEK